MASDPRPTDVTELLARWREGSNEHEARLLAALDPRPAEIVELRYFGGLTEEEVATLKHISPATVRRDVASARFWLRQRMRSA